MTVVIVTHEDDVAARAQEVVQFRDGAIATEASRPSQGRP
jgi:ABC-type lipoprotein export system ATPase subunit